MNIDLENGQSEDLLIMPMEPCPIPRKNMKSKSEQHALKSKVSRDSHPVRAFLTFSS